MTTTLNRIAAQVNILKNHGRTYQLLVFRHYVEHINQTSRDHQHQHRYHRIERNNMIDNLCRILGLVSIDVNTFDLITSNNKSKENRIANILKEIK